MENDPNFIPDSQFVPDQSSAQPVALTATPTVPKATGSTPAFIPDSQFQSDEDKYGSISQQIITGLEGAGEAASFGLSTGLETALGVNPEDIRMRRETNPYTHAAGQIGGLAASALIPGVGEANLLRGLGEGAVAGATKLGAGALTRAAVRGAAETALFQGGDELSKYLSGTHESVGNIVANVGLGAVLGAGGSAIFEAASPLWRASHEASVDQSIQSFKNRVLDGAVDSKADQALDTVHDSSFLGRLGQQKPHAAKIIDIGERNNWPVLEGMTSGSKEVQMAEDALLHGPPTLPSIARRQAYNDAYKAVTNDLGNMLGGEAPLSETQVGNTIKQSLSQKLSTENEPIKALYNEIEPYRQQIPVSDQTTGSLANSVMRLADEQGLIPGSERYDFVKTMANGLENVDNLQSLKNFKTELWKSAGPLTKDLAGNVSEHLEQIEDQSIRRFADELQTPEAKAKITNLLDQTEQAKSMYREFREKLQTLGNSLGKKKIYGPQNFIDFIDEINPQSLSRKIFNENNTEFADFFSKNFPEEMNAMRQYQRGTLREAATKNEVFKPEVAIKKSLNFEPEMQKILFSPEEMGKIQDAKTYLGSFPEKFNPSGTAHESAFRAFFEHPTGAVIGNARDYAIQQFIKSFGKANPGANSKLNELFPYLGKAVLEKDSNPVGFKNAVDFVVSSLKGENTLGKATKAVFESGKTVLPNLINSTRDHEKLDEKIKGAMNNPEALFQTAGDVGHYMPDHAQGLSQMAMTAVNYLNSQRPQPTKMSPLDSDLPIPQAQKAAYQRTLSIADQPLLVFQHIKQGTLLPQDVKTLQAIYPGYYQYLSQKLMSAMTDHLADDGKVPYKTRQGLSLFLGQPLDSTMTSSSLQAIQSVFARNKAMAQAPQPGQEASKKGTQKLSKLSQNMMTTDQSRAARADKA